MSLGSLVWLPWGLFQEFVIMPLCFYHSNSPDIILRVCHWPQLILPDSREHFPHVLPDQGELELHSSLPSSDLRLDITVCVSGWSGADIFGRFQTALYKWEEIRFVSSSQHALKTNKHFRWMSVFFSVACVFCCSACRGGAYGRRRVVQQETVHRLFLPKDVEGAGHLMCFLFLCFFTFELVLEYYVKMKALILMLVCLFSGADRCLWDQKSNDSSSRHTAFLMHSDFGSWNQHCFWYVVTPPPPLFLNEIF